jgi:hypothetical protein
MEPARAKSKIKFMGIVAFLGMTEYQDGSFLHYGWPVLLMELLRELWLSTRHFKQ